MPENGWSYCDDIESPPETGRKQYFSVGNHGVLDSDVGRIQRRVASNHFGPTNVARSTGKRNQIEKS